MLTISRSDLAADLDVIGKFPIGATTLRRVILSRSGGRLEVRSEPPGYAAVRPSGGPDEAVAVDYAGMAALVRPGPAQGDVALEPGGDGTVLVIDSGVALGTVAGGPALVEPAAEPAGAESGWAVVQAGPLAAALARAAAVAGRKPAGFGPRSDLARLWTGPDGTLKVDSFSEAALSLNDLPGSRGEGLSVLVGWDLLAIVRAMIKRAPRMPKVDPGEAWLRIGVDGDGLLTVRHGLPWLTLKYYDSGDGDKLIALAERLPIRAWFPTAYSGAPGDWTEGGAPESWWGGRWPDVRGIAALRDGGGGPSLEAEPKAIADAVQALGSKGGAVLMAGPGWAAAEACPGKGTRRLSGQPPESPGARAEVVLNASAVKPLAAHGPCRVAFLGAHPGLVLDGPGFRTIIGGVDADDWRAAPGHRDY